MENIDKTVKSKYPPKQKNVNWIDTSGDEPVMKVFNNGRWKPIGGGGSGSIGGISTIDKDTQANFVPRDPTAEDEAKFSDSPIVKVIDLPDGKVPLFAIISGGEDEPGEFQVFSLTYMSTPTKGSPDGFVRYGVEGGAAIEFLLSGDWTLLGMQGD